MDEFAVEWQVELFKEIVVLRCVYSFWWGWAKKDGTARQMKRQKVRVSYNKIREKLRVGLFRIIMLFYWSEWAEWISQTFSLRTARDEAKNRTHCERTFTFCPP